MVHALIAGAHAGQTASGFEFDQGNTVNVVEFGRGMERIGNFLIRCGGI